MCPWVRYLTSLNLISPEHRLGLPPHLRLSACALAIPQGNRALSWQDSMFFFSHLKVAHFGGSDYVLSILKFPCQMEMVILIPGASQVAQWQRTHLPKQEMQETGSIPGLGRPPGGEQGNPAPIFVPGEPHGQRSLAGYSPWGRAEWDTAEHTHNTNSRHIGW